MRRALLLLLAGCPSSYSFQGHIYTVVTKPGANVAVLGVHAGNDLEPIGLSSILNATVDCTGCDGNVKVENGTFVINLGTDERPITLRVSAPGFEPAELQINEPPGNSQVGNAHYVIVLAPAK
jgi:hypothetical protein